MSVSSSRSNCTPHYRLMKASSPALQKLPEKLWADVMELAKKEREAGGVLDVDTKVSIFSYFSRSRLDRQGYWRQLIRIFQTIQALQEAHALRRSANGCQKACSDNGYAIDPRIKHISYRIQKDPQRRRIRCLHPERERQELLIASPSLPDAYGRRKNHRRLQYVLLCTAFLDRLHPRQAGAEGFLHLSYD